MNNLEAPPRNPRRRNLREWLRRENISFGLAATILFFLGSVAGLGLAFSTAIELKNPFTHRSIGSGAKSSSSSSQFIPLPSSPLSSVYLESLDNRSPEDSRTLQLVGRTESGVTSVSVWSSCDDETHRMQSFKKGDQSFTYKISPTLGNLCRGQNNFIVRVYGKIDGKEILLDEEFNKPVDSKVGLRKRSDLPVLRFLEAHTLPGSRSIEDDAMLPSRLLPSNAFTLACHRNEMEIMRSETLVKINDTLSARFEMDNVAQRRSSGSIAFMQIAWLAKTGETLSPSAAITPFPVGRCDTVTGYELFSAVPDRALLDPVRSTDERMFFNGLQWMSIEDLLYQQVPLNEADTEPMRLIVYKDVFGLVVTTEIQADRGEWMFPDQRPEYLFSMNDGAFLGVVWHRKR